MHADHKILFRVDSTRWRSFPTDAHVRTNSRVNAPVCNCPELTSVSLHHVTDRPFSDPELPRKVMDVVDRVVDVVRKRTTLPIVTIIRGLVFGTIIVVVGLALVVVTLIALARGAHELLDIWLDRATAVWVSYLVLGIVFVALGGVLMRKRRSVSPGNN